MRQLTRSTAYCFVRPFTLVICACTIVVLTAASAVVGVGIILATGLSNDPMNCLITTVAGGAALVGSINFVADTIGSEMAKTQAAIREVWQ